MDVWWKGQPNDGEVDSWISGNENCLVAFHRYRACTSETPSGSPFGSECDAGKGVAYVRLRQTNGRELDVFWSHTQATLRTPEYDVPLPKFEKQRRKQLEELAAMVAHWSPLKPIEMLAQRARYGLFPAEGDVIATGPHFVTRADAGKAIELSRRSIR